MGARERVVERVSGQDKLVETAVKAVAALDVVDAIVDEVVRKTNAGETGRATVRSQIGAELLNLLLRGFVKLHGAATARPAPDSPPKVSALVRAQAKHGQRWATNRMHQPVGISPAHGTVLQMMDGSKDMAALTQAVANALADGSLKAHKDGVAVDDAEAQKVLASQFAAQCVREFNSYGLLE